ncbi:ImmA/IrrE family metallo-endopeptidase [Caballeronia sordidicola]|nr:ImmA/IrrE family metallo-endopeptidase [Caballeronia sordidicola]
MQVLFTVPDLRTPSALADFLLAKCQYKMYESAPPVDVDKVARLLRINVAEHSDPSAGAIIGKITLTEEGPADIWINPAENAYAPKRRFTLAHEIAHFCMHRSSDRLEFVDTRSTMNRSESYWNSYESEANRFAAEMLMPQQMIESLGREVIDSYKAEHNVEKMPLTRFVDVMAVKFRVSRPAMEFRLKNVGIGTFE